MKIQKTNYQPQFKGKLSVVEAAKDMITTEEVNELKQLFNSLTEEANEFDLFIGKKGRIFIDKHNNGGVFEQYPMKLKMKISNMHLEQDLSQSAYVGDGITKQQMPFEVVKNWLIKVTKPQTP